mmetsp:Transcript_40097/g.87577  ORF Transcript_40097/g.87577 Transcript_40097/m.87577 type:complete len:208 (-) Transcript_40097:328-951(-)
MTKWEAGARPMPAPMNRNSRRGRQARGRSARRAPIPPGASEPRSPKQRSAKLPCNTTWRLESSQTCSRTSSTRATPRPVLKRIALRSITPLLSAIPETWIQPSGMTATGTALGSLIGRPPSPPPSRKNAANVSGRSGRIPSGRRAIAPSPPHSLSSRGKSPRARPLQSTKSPTRQQRSGSRSRNLSGASSKSSQGPGTSALTERVST